MSVTDNHPLLKKNINDLSVSENFRNDFFNAGFETLSDALAFDGDELINEKHFTYHTITELITLLNEAGLTRLFKD